MKTLLEIKDEVAKELQQLDVWVDLRHFKESTELSLGAEKYFDLVCSRYASQQVEEYKQMLLTKIIREWEKKNGSEIYDLIERL